MIEIGDLGIAEMSKRPRTAVVGKDLQKRAFERHPHYAVAHARGYDAETHVQAMDIEGIDVAVIYGTRGRQVLMHDDLQPEVAAALARAHNNWTRDFCAYNPERLKFAAQVAFHDAALAAKEARRAVRELGAVAVIGNPNPINGRHVHDPSLEPLWAAIEELGVPVGFHPTGQSSLRDDIARRYLDTPNGRVIGVAGRNPVELMMAFGSMAAGGVLERHPRLRCAFLEGTCGWLPWWLWRLDEAWEKFGPGSEVQISHAAEPVLLPPVLHRHRRRREAAPPGHRGDRRRQHRRLDRLPALRRPLPRRHRGVRAPGGRQRQVEGEDPLGQLRAALQPGRILERAPARLRYFSAATAICLRIFASGSAPTPGVHVCPCKCSGRLVAGMTQVAAGLPGPT